jgi:hypothetical protein
MSFLERSGFSITGNCCELNTEEEDGSAVTAALLVVHRGALGEMGTRKAGIVPVWTRREETRRETWTGATSVI